MLSKCANPTCKARFRSLREGKLFHFDVSSAERSTTLRIVGGKKSPQKVEHYWLCADCSGMMTLAQSRSGITVVPLAAPTRLHIHRAAAS